MKKEKLITRTMSFTKAEVMCVNTETAEVTYREVTVPGKLTGKEILAAIPEEENVSFVSVRSSYVDEKIFGLEESVFLKYAHEVVRKSKEEKYEAETEG